jgi:hypothetical protein
MEWAVVIQKILSGSPWAILLGVCWYHWRTRAQNLSVIKEKDGVIKAKDEQIAVLNTEYRDMTREMAAHTVTILEAAKTEAVELQERRVKETVKMQKQFVTTMGDLKLTLDSITKNQEEQS